MHPLHPAKTLNRSLKEFGIVRDGPRKSVQMALSRIVREFRFLDHRLEKGHPVLAPFLAAPVQPRYLSLGENPIALRATAVKPKLSADSDLMRSPLRLRNHHYQIALR